MNRIAELRKKHGISQKELAYKFNIAQNTLSQYENELRTPSARVIAEMANFFEVSTNYLLGIPTEKKSNTNLDLLDYRNITKIHQTDNANKANILISLGWKLLHIGEDKSVNSDGSGYSTVEYTLGWYGEPEQGVIPDFDNDFDYAYDPEIM